MVSLLDDLLSKNPDFILNNQYKSILKLTTGSFSNIFTAKTVGKDTPVVLKAPYKTSNSLLEISREAILLLKLKELKTVPKVLYLQADARCEVMVLEKLGQSLEALKQEYNNFSLKTTILLADQLLTILEDVHRNGVLHRDIKPSNILIGEAEHRNKVFLIDFDIGISMSQNAARTGNEVKEFVGTKAFASRGAHKCAGFSRKDDLESLGFTLVYLYMGKLPWTHSKCDLISLGLVKSQFMEKGFLEDLPKEFGQFFKYLDRLNSDEVPDYGYLRGLFVSMAARFGFDLSKSAFEWVEEENSTWSASHTEEQKEEKEYEISDDSTSEDSVQKKVMQLNKGFNQKFFSHAHHKAGSDFMKGFKKAFLKTQSHE